MRPSCLDQYFKDYPGIENVYIHFDNDAAGLNAGINIKAALKDRNVRVILQYPPEGVKDVNEYLQAKRKGNLIDLIRRAETAMEL